MLVLAGGLGTRLRTAVADVPKPMAPVSGKPFLEYLLDHWIGEGVRRFVLSTGYLGHIIENHFGNGYRGASIDYVREPLPLGTGGALRLALATTDWSGRSILMANGDTWFPVSLDQFHRDALHLKADITLALKHVGSNDRYGGVKVSATGSISSFSEKLQGSGLINGGCYLLDTPAFATILSPLPERFSLEREVFPGLIPSGKIGSSIQDKPFLDIGIPEDYRRASKFFI
ncbi:MAG: nucleotidyltransferase family protein [Proteobacteria bacterium]|nr:nucleotidyltransferase family protein [Pseudomonadota bacterium]HQR04672.1 nucleotidyltransferase family protein [Rhodocyclaceae bacterium]